MQLSLRTFLFLDLLNRDPVQRGHLTTGRREETHEHKIDHHDRHDGSPHAQQPRGHKQGSHDRDADEPDRRPRRMPTLPELRGAAASQSIERPAEAHVDSIPSSSKVSCAARATSRKTSTASSSRSSAITSYVS